MDKARRKATEQLQDAEPACFCKCKSLPFYLTLFLFLSAARGATDPLWSFHNASGVVRHGNDLLIVDDKADGAYFRFPLKRIQAPLIEVIPTQMKRQQIRRGELAMDLEAIEVLADGRVVVLSERLRSLVSKEGVVAEYEAALSEFGQRGLEGLAVDALPGQASRVAVLYEGGYPEPAGVMPQLREAVSSLALQPLVIVHDIARGARGLKVHLRDAVRVVELQVPLPLGSEPYAQRFRSPDLVWFEMPGAHGSEKGFIVILSSQNSAGKREYKHHWLQRFDSTGKPVGDPLDIATLVPPELKAANWEGLAWYEPGASLVLVHESAPNVPTHALFVKIPASWKSGALTAEKFPYRLTRDVPYYRTGPQQARPPDGTLRAGTRVILIYDGGSYSRVRTEGGVEGYVSTDAIERHTQD